MHTHNGTLYPMLGVGAFMTMFWTGVVVGHELGLGCVSLLIMGLLSGCIATVGVCELQRRDGQGFAVDPRAVSSGRALPTKRPASGEPAPASARHRQPGAAALGRGLPLESW